MKTKLLAATVVLTSIVTQTQAQVITDTVSMNAGYSTQKWYSLQNDEQGVAQAKDNWDIAFEITGYTASILANTQKANFILYKAPYSISNYATIDTAGINNWEHLYNSDTTWAIGAFNKGANANNGSDLGWGVYDLNTHIITGDSCYVIKLSNTSYKKIKIENLAGGIYTFSYADINGANANTATIDKTTYSGKNFAYYNLTSNTAMDREPAASTWDLTFTKYTTFIPSPYGVTGVVSNKGVTVAQANDVVSPATYNNYAAHTPETAINTIGYDFKYFNLSANAWQLSTDTVYFVKSRQGDIWKLRFTGFGGSSNGNFIFSKEKLTSVSINDINNNTVAKLSVYPNPSLGNQTNVIYSIEQAANVANITVYNTAGVQLHSSQLSTVAGMYNYQLNTTNYIEGIYIIKLYVDGKVITQQFIKQ